MLFQRLIGLASASEIILGRKPHPNLSSFLVSVAKKKSCGLPFPLPSPCSKIRLKFRQPKSDPSIPPNGGCCTTAKHLLARPSLATRNRSLFKVVTSSDSKREIRVVGGLNACPKRRDDHSPWPHGQQLSSCCCFPPSCAVEAKLCAATNAAPTSPFTTATANPIRASCPRTSVLPCFPTVKPFTLDTLAPGSCIVRRAAVRSSPCSSTTSPRTSLTTTATQTCATLHRPDSSQVSSPFWHSPFSLSFEYLR